MILEQNVNETLCFIEWIESRLIPAGGRGPSRQMIFIDDFHKILIDFSLVFIDFQCIFIDFSLAFHRFSLHLQKLGPPVTVRRLSIRVSSGRRGLERGLADFIL